MIKLLEKYFKYALFFEWGGAVLISLISNYLIQTESFRPPTLQSSNDLISDLSGIGLTSTGFFLTILTVLVSFKNTFKAVTKLSDSNSLFQTFFSSEKLYNGTISQLKSSIFNLILISGLMFISRLTLINEYSIYQYPLICGSLYILCSSNFRCLYILNKIIGYDKKKTANNY